MSWLKDWFAKDERLDRVIAEQKEVLKESKVITRKANKLHMDTKHAVESTLKTINNTWGMR